jgi:hypothetical protein
MKDMGRVMAALKDRYAGQMDFSKASATVKDLLNGPKRQLGAAVRTLGDS